VGLREKKRVGVEGRHSLEFRAEKRRPLRHPGKTSQVRRRRKRGGQKKDRDLSKKKKLVPCAGEKEGHWCPLPKEKRGG